MEKSRHRMGLASRRSTGLILIWLAVSLPFLLLYITSRRVVVNEIRNHAMGIAISVAASLDVAELESVRGATDAESNNFKRIQGMISHLRDVSPDVHFIYTMRRSGEAFAPVYIYKYIVDSLARDFNGNGIIDEDEKSELPGTPYNARELPAMISAWDRPDADHDITTDPPYPDLISGYAPVKDPDGRTVAIVGVDVLAKTVNEKMFAIRSLIVVIWLVLGSLITLAVRLYYQQRDTRERIEKLNSELGGRNAMLREANERISRDAERFERELKLALAVQMGFLPKTFPRGDRIIFDKYYMTCAILGGDLFDVFDVNEDHVGVFMADVAGRGVSAALISGLLRLAISSVRSQGGKAPLPVTADLTRPNAVVRALNELLVKEMPEGEFITLVYAVVDLAENKLHFANAGHPWPVRYVAKGRTHVVCRGGSGMALGLEAGHDYPLVTVDIAERDKIVFFTNGMIEAMNAAGEQFGEERFFAVMDEFGHCPPNEIIAATREAVEKHRGKQEVSDDFSMLVAEIR